MSKWEEYDFENRIVGILQELAGPRHHMGPAFLSPYQIAIEFTRRFTDDAQRLAEDGFGLGGEGAGVRNSLPQYIGQQLSARLRNGRITNIEGGFISSKRMANRHPLIHDTAWHQSLTVQDETALEAAFRHLIRLPAIRLCRTGFCSYAPLAQLQKPFSCT